MMSMYHGSNPAHQKKGAIKDLARENQLEQRGETDGSASRRRAWCSAWDGPTEGRASSSLRFGRWGRPHGSSLHGFPQTWWEWQRVIPILVQAGYRVIAPDYRGAGNSSRPAGGYDKRTMAGDIHQLLREHLQIDRPVAMVGHDIGLMVAFAYAEMFSDEVSHLVVMDAPLPGTSVFDKLRVDLRSGILLFMVRAMFPKCWLQAGNVSICNCSITLGSLIPVLVETARLSRTIRRCPSCDFALCLG
jgi:hypothetical protein